MFYHLFILFFAIAPKYHRRSGTVHGNTSVCGVHKYFFFLCVQHHAQTHITYRIILSFTDTCYLGELLRTFIVPNSTMFFRDSKNPSRLSVGFESYIKKRKTIFRCHLGRFSWSDSVVKRVRARSFGGN